MSRINRTWKHLPRACRLALTIISTLYSLSATPAAAAEKTLYSFKSFPAPGQPDTGVNPSGTLFRDASGALYGANMLGGAYYNGTIFKLSPPTAGHTDWTLSVLYTFTGWADGGMPNPDLIMDSTGAIYGTANGGGSWMDEGLVYKLTPPRSGTGEWKQTVIHYFDYSFVDGDGDGCNPGSGLIMDKSGALYGTTILCGDSSAPSGIGSGTVYKLTPMDAARTNWQETILYRFKGGADGDNPFAPLIMDSAGALYGTTLYGGTGNCTDYFSTLIGCGTAFKLSPPATGQTAWKKTTIHNFADGADGNVPEGKLLLDASGAVYGTTLNGGKGPCTDGLLTPVGCGIVFKLSPPAAGQTAWTESVLHTFMGPDGAFPQGGLLTDATGALFGTASGGGPSSYGVGNFGLVYRLAPPAWGQTLWAETDLYDFDVSTSGEQPVGELVRDPNGHFFGLTYGGGANLGGTVYEIIP